MSNPRRPMKAFWIGFGLAALPGAAGAQDSAPTTLSPIDIYTNTPPAAGPVRSFQATTAHILKPVGANVAKLGAAEIAALPLFCRGSALRFFLTRLYDWIMTPVGAMVTKKDPLEYLRKLRFHQHVNSAAEYGLDVTVPSRVKP